VRLFLHQLRGEQLLFWRSREAAIFTFLLPIVLFLLLGEVYRGKIDGYPAPSMLLVGMLTYGLANTAFAGMSISLIVRREGGVLKRIRATPLPGWIYFCSLLASTLVVFALEAVALIVLARVAYGVKMPERPGSFVVVLLLGAVSFACLGLAAAAIVRSGEGSSAVISIIVLPMAFLSGSFGPTRHFPAFLKALGDVLPLTYVLELARRTSLDGLSLWRPQALIVLIAWAAVGLVVALRWFRWEPRAA
jgi:ABC-2 type transport system permease protein